MKIFISSVISGMESLRDAAERGARMLGHTTLRSEQLGARPHSPQQACLGLVRQADAVLLLLGRRYGDFQPSGLSPTHEEFREARERCSVLCFVQSGVEPEPAQAAFIREVQEWAGGHYTAQFAEENALLSGVVGALHQLDLSAATAPVDADEMAQRARELLEPERSSSRVRLGVAISLGPKQALLRPSGLANPELLRFLKSEALTGEHAVLSTDLGTRDEVIGGRVMLVQENAEVAVDELGSVVVISPISRKSQHDDRLVLSVIEEDLIEQAEVALAFSNQVLEHLDSRHRLSHFTPVTRLVGADHFGWQTRAEHTRSPNSVAMGFAAPASVVSLQPSHRPRAALQFERRVIAEDLIALIKRGRS